MAEGVRRDMLPDFCRACGVAHGSLHSCFMKMMAASDLSLGVHGKFRGRKIYCQIHSMFAVEYFGRGLGANRPSRNPLQIGLVGDLYLPEV